MQDSDILDSLVPSFIEHALEHLNVVDGALMALEKKLDDAECVRTLFMRVHSLKGCAAFLKLDDIRSLGHDAETLLDHVRSGRKKATPRITQRLFSCFDLLKSLVTALGKSLDAGVPLPENGTDQRVKQELEALGRAINFSDGEIEGRKSPGILPAGSTPWVELSESLLTDFRAEALENIEQCEKALIDLSKTRSDPELIKTLFRGVHSVKGTSSYLGLDAIASLAHELESLLELVRARRPPSMDDMLLDVCFEAVDQLQGLIGAPFDLALTQKAVEFKVRIDVESGKYGRDASTRIIEVMAKTSPVDIFLDSASQHVTSLQLFLAETTLGPDRLDASFRAAHSLKGGARYMGLEAVEKQSAAIEDSLETLKGAGSLPEVKALVAESLAEVERLLSAMSLAEEQPPPVAAQAPVSETAMAAKTMRVEQSLLDTFMNLVGELIVARNALRHTGQRLEAGDEEPRAVMKDLKSACAAIDRISDEMQRNMTRMRMVPVRKVFEKFSRMARDITRKNGKKVDLLFQGEDTEIDKGVAEELADPLVHIIRNALDHGIERPDTRRMAGKPETGTILLKAAHEGNNIVIEAIDDGKGIDPDVILKKALERNLVSQADAAGLSKEDIFNFIFLPGFSTAAQVTDISGRGVGMDVVLTNLRKLKGTARVSSDPGQGTRVRLEVPLTLAMVEAMLVKSGDSVYAIPMAAVRETVKVPRGGAWPLMSKRVVCLRGETVGVVSLAELLGREAPDMEAELRLLVLEAGQATLGVVVDAILRHEEIVVKPLADCLAGLPGLAGASVLGDGRTILILDPSQLIAMAAGRQG